MSEQDEPALTPNEFQQIPEQLIMQRLSQYFLSPSAKTLPYCSYFSHHRRRSVYCLQFLWGYVRAPNHSQQVVEALLGLLPTEPYGQNWALAVIVQSGGAMMQALLSRYIGLPSLLAEELVRRSINSKQVEELVVGQACGVLGGMHLEDRAFVANKIVNLGYSGLLVDQAGSDSAGSMDLPGIYPFIIKKQNLLLALLAKMDKPLARSQISDIIDQFHSTTDHEVISRLLSKPTLTPDRAPQLLGLLSPHPGLLAHVLEWLLVWWVEGNDHYLIYNSVKFRVNLFVLGLRHLPKQAVLAYSCQISLGIERRLLTATNSKREVVNLVFATLASKLEYALPGDQFRLELLPADPIEKEQQFQPILVGDQLVSQRPQEKNKESGSEPQQQLAESEELGSIVIKPPRNLYDCILGLRNPGRRKITLKMLPRIIRGNPDDLLFTWRDLTNELMYNLSDQTKISVVSLFVVRPEQFIETMAEVFFTKEHSLNDKIVMMEVLEQGVQELSRRPAEIEQHQGSSQFYFKKVTSRYLKPQKQEVNTSRDEQRERQRTRRWGHTRIAHQQKVKQKFSNGVSLRIVKNQPHINRLYEIANQLFFQIISKLLLLPLFPSEHMFTVPMLRLLAALSQNLINHIQKYKILSEVVDICYFVIEHVEKQNKESKSAQLREQNRTKWKDSSLAVLNTLNKVSLVVDKFMPARVLQGLHKCILKLRASSEYGIAPIVDMIEANVYGQLEAPRMLL